MNTIITNLIERRNFAPILKDIEYYASLLSNRVGFFNYADYLKINISTLKLIEAGKDKKMPKAYKLLKTLALITDSYNCLDKMVLKVSNNR